MDSAAAAKISGPKAITGAQKVVAGGLVVCLASLLFAFRDTWKSLFNLWLNSSEYGHGLLVAPLVIYLLWLRRHAIATLPVRPSVTGVLASGSMIVAWAMSNIMGILIGEQLALVLLLLFIPWAVAGWRLMRECALPILMLLVAVPIWNYINPILQANTATAATALVRLVGVPVFNEGVYLTIPGGRFLVADVCSGMRYLLASMTLGALFAILNLRFVWTRLLLFVTSFFLSMVFNWIRVAIIVSAGHYLGMETSLVHRHLWLGWALFGVAAIVLLWLGNALQRYENKSPSSPAVAIWPGLDSERHRILLSGLYALICSAVLWAGVGLVAVANEGISGTPLELNLRTVRVPGFQNTSVVDSTGWRASFLNTDAEVQTVFKGSGLPVSVYMGYYRSQRQGAEVVNDSNSLYDREVWQRTAVRPKPELVEISADLKAQEFQIIRGQGAGHLLLWRLYWVDNGFVSNGIAAKLRQITGLIHGNRAAAGLVFSVPVTASVTTSRRQLRAFAQAALAPVGNYLSSLDYR